MALQNKKDLKKPDEFSSFFHKTFSRLASQGKNLVILGALFVIITGGLMFYFNQSKKVEDAARNAHFEMGMALSEELKALKEKLEAKEKASQSKKTTNSKISKKKEPLPEPVATAYIELDVAANFPKTIEKAKAVAEKFPGSRAAFDAQVDLAKIYLDHGEEATAEKWYLTAEKDAPGIFEKAVSKLGVGHARENSSRFKEALESFNSALDLGVTGLKGDILMAIARCQTALKDFDAAKKTYDRLITELPKSDLKSKAEKLRDR